jgi:hypothetical protein
MRVNRIATISELKDFLKDDIQFFKLEIKKAHSQAYKDLAEGRLQEAQWILSNVAQRGQDE